MNDIPILKILLSNQLIAYTVESRNVQIPDNIRTNLKIAPLLETGLSIKDFELLLEDSSIVRGDLEIMTDPLNRGYQLYFSSTNSIIYDNSDTYLGKDSEERSSNHTLFGTTVETQRRTRVDTFSAAEKIRVALYKRGEVYSVSMMIYEGLK